MVIIIALKMDGNEENKAFIDTFRPSFFEITLRGRRTLSILMILTAFKLI